MGFFVTIGVWVIFSLLVVYVYLSGKKGKLDDYTGILRKCWYMIFIFGSLVFLSVTGFERLFTNWENFLVVLIGFIIFDSLLFLELHFSKLGGQELKSARVQVGMTQEGLDATQRKMEHLPIILTTFEFTLYNLDEDTYIDQLEDFLNRYGDRENLVINLFPYNNEKEQELVLHNLIKKARGKANRFLSRGDSVSLLDDSLALYPFKLLDYVYVVQAETIGDNQIITKTDGTAISTLIVTYNLTVDENIIEGGEGL